MRHLTSILIAAILTTATATVMADGPAPPAAGAPSTPSGFAAIERQHAALFAPMRADTRSKVQGAARALIFDMAGDQQRMQAHKGKPFVPMDLAAATRAQVAKAQSFGIAAATGADIEALITIVMMQAAQDADADLRAQMAAMRAANKAKEAFRQGQVAVAAALAAEKAQLRKSDADEITERAKQGLDSLSELGETESLRLQMAMDRLSKLMDTLSNLLKKNSDAAQGIVKNMK
jgi:hypothetical protein